MVVEQFDIQHALQSYTLANHLHNAPVHIVVKQGQKHQRHVRLVILLDQMAYVEKIHQIVATTLDIIVSNTVRVRRRNPTVMSVQI